MAEKREESWQENLEKKVEAIEERIDAVAKKLEEKGREFERRVEEKAKYVEEGVKKRSHGGHNIFWGIVLIVLGCLWLGKNLKWFDYDVPWISVVLIAVGIFLIIRHWENEKKEDDEEQNKEG